MHLPGPCLLYDSSGDRAAMWVVCHVRVVTWTQGSHLGLWVPAEPAAVQEPCWLGANPVPALAWARDAPAVADLSVSGGAGVALGAAWGQCSAHCTLVFGNHLHRAPQPGRLTRQESIFSRPWRAEGQGPGVGGVGSSWE